jgi:signal transduction histidine kinase
MAWRGSDTSVEERGLPRALRAVAWLRRHRELVVVLAVAGIVVSFVLDLLIPGYAIAGFYLFPLLLVTFALSERRAVGILSAVCLGLTIYVLVLQDRANAQNILLVAFGVVAGAGLIELGSLYNRYDRLYEKERATTVRLHSLTTQLQRLQEVSVLDSERPPSELLLDVVSEARQLLSCDGGMLFRLDHGDDTLSLMAALGPPIVAGDPPIVAGDPPTVAGDPPKEAPGPPTGAPGASPAPANGGDNLLPRLPAGTVDLAFSTRRPVGVPDLLRSEEPREGPRDETRGLGAQAEWRSCLVVPLVVRGDAFGVLLLPYVASRSFSDEDLGLASAFGDQAALAIENARLREQVQRTATAAERSRLARELHDSVTQSLFAASLTAEALYRDRDTASPRVRDSLLDVQRLTRGALAEMRTLLVEMRPGALAQSPLGDLLEHVVQATQARTRIALELAVTNAPPLPGDATIALYRIAQEAMNNVVRHSQATRSWVRLTGSAAAADLVVGDDGRGFDPGAVGPEQLGLRIMRERAEAVGAALRITSEVGHGTVIAVTWPASGGDGT